MRLRQNMSHCPYMISHQVRGDTVCVVVCVFSSLCVRGDCLRTGTRQPNQRDTVCYIAEYKHPHYRVSLNVSDTERRMKGPTISEKNEKKNCITGGRIWQAAQKSCSESTKPPQCLPHLPIDSRRERQRGWFWYMGPYIYWYTVVYNRAYSIIHSWTSIEIEAENASLLFTDFIINSIVNIAVPTIFLFLLT